MIEISRQNIFVALFSLCLYGNYVMFVENFYNSFLLDIYQ